MSDAVVEFEHVSLSFESSQPGSLRRGGPGAVRALDDVTVAVPAGVVAGIAGPDGAGKTTLMRLAVGLLAPTAGQVRTLGHELPREAGKLKPEVGYLPQRLGLQGHLTAQENLQYFAALNGVTEALARERIQHLLALTGLAPFERRAAQHLSGGMRQKLALACAVLHQPRLMVLDEPTTGVDPLFRRDTWELIYGLLRDAASVIVATPSWEEAVHCQWLMVLDAGRVLTHGEPAQLAEAAAGLVWELSASPGAERALAASPWALSVGRRGASLHVVIAPQQREAAERLLQEALPGNGLRQVEPTLEDAVVVLTRGHEP